MELPDDPNLLFWIKSGAYTLLSIVAGWLGYVMRNLDGRKKLSFWRGLLEGIAAGFVGVLVLFLCNAMNMSDQWTGVIVGVSGWLGANASIRMLEILVYKKLGISKSQEEPVLEREDDKQR